MGQKQTSKQTSKKYQRIQNTGTRSAQRTIINIEESRNQIGTAYHHKYRRIQEPDRHNVPHPIPKHTDKSQQRSTHNNAELLPCPTGWEREGGRSGQCHLVRDVLFPKVTVYSKKRLYTVTFLLCKGDVPMNSAFTYNYELLMSLISELESEIKRV